MNLLLNYDSNHRLMRETTQNDTKFCDGSYYFNSAEVTGLYISPWTNFEFSIRKQSTQIRAHCFVNSDRFASENRMIHDLK